MLTLHGIIVFKKPVEPEKRSSPGDSTNARGWVKMTVDLHLERDHLI